MNTDNWPKNACVRRFFIQESKGKYPELTFKPNILLQNGKFLKINVTHG